MNGKGSGLKLVLVIGLSTAFGCRGPQKIEFASRSVTVAGDWHEYTPDGHGYMTSLHLRRSGVPIIEQDSIASFYLSSNAQTNTVPGAQKWQESTAKSTVGNFVVHSKEQISGTYKSLCVTGTNAGGVEVLDCVVEGAPLMFSFAGSKDAEAEARAMLQSLQ